MNQLADFRHATLTGFFATLMVAMATAAELPDGKLLSENPKQFFEEIGKAAAQDLPNGATNVDRAKAVVELLGKNAEKYKLYANVDLKGRFRDIGNQQGNCGYWRDNLQDAFKAAGIANDRVASAESYTYHEIGGGDPGEIVRKLKNLDVNNVHTSVLVLQDGQVYTFDVWQHGYDKRSLGKGSLHGVGNSKYNGMPIDEWIAIQKRAGRGLMGMEETTVEQSDVGKRMLEDRVKAVRRLLKQEGDSSLANMTDEELAMSMQDMLPLLIANPKISNETLMKLLLKRNFDIRCTTVTYDGKPHWVYRQNTPLTFKFRGVQLSLTNELIDKPAPYPEDHFDVITLKMRGRYIGGKVTGIAAETSLLKHTTLGPVVQMDKGGAMSGTVDSNGKLLLRVKWTTSAEKWRPVVARNADGEASQLGGWKPRKSDLQQTSYEFHLRLPPEALPNAFLKQEQSEK